MRRESGVGNRESRAVSREPCFPSDRRVVVGGEGDRLGGAVLGRGPGKGAAVRLEHRHGQKRTKIVVGGTKPPAQ